jgi:hypothetical protein
VNAAVVQRHGDARPAHGGEAGCDTLRVELVVDVPLQIGSGARTRLRLGEFGALSMV